jgi:hypothetical protein
MGTSLFCLKVPKERADGILTAHWPVRVFVVYALHDEHQLQSHHQFLHMYPVSLPMQASNKFRSSVYRLVTLQYFDYMLMLVVALSCVEVRLHLVQCTAGLFP